ncbi:MAG: hypothetical protein ACI8W8_001930 [Rhodothermales bacterium]|jgi:hypothetical protein
MPQGSTLSAEPKALYAQWIADGAPEGAPQNQAPVAIAGSNFSIAETALGALDGRSSTDDAGIISYVWTQSLGPGAALNDLGDGQASFSAPAVGAAGTSLTFTLTVTDGAGVADTADIIVTVTNVNQAPQAVAAGDSNVLSGQDFSLDGSGSSDSDGKIVSYTWSRISGPAVSIANSADGIVAISAPAVDRASALRLQLRVVDDEGASASDSHSLMIFPNAPLVAKAGRDRDIGADQITFLNSHGSVPLVSIQWTQLQGVTVDLQDADSANAYFLSPAADAALEIQLEVEDVFGRTAQDAVLLQAKPSLSIPLRRGWNLLSFPFDLSADVELPGRAFSWTGTTLQALERGTLAARRGIWLHAPGPMQLDAFGETNAAGPLVARPHTWELVGPLLAVTAPSGFDFGWKFTARGYRPLRAVSVLQPGEAYWLYFNTTQPLNLGESP